MTRLRVLCVRTNFLLFYLFIFPMGNFLIGQDLTLTNPKAVLNLPKNDEILATVDSIKISVEEFTNSYEFGPAFIKRNKNSKEKHLNYIINEKLLALDGYANGLDITGQAEEIYTAIENDLAADELFKADILSDISINDGEIDTLINKKRLHLELKWLYSKTQDGILDYAGALKSGAEFDSLFNNQLSDSVKIDERSMETSRYQLEYKNPSLSEIVDSLEIGKCSSPIQTSDGWYIIKLNNAWMNMITTETEFNKLKSESINALKKMKMDKLSDIYVNDMIVKQSPIIRRNEFNVLRTFVGQYVVSPEKFREWDLSGRASDALKKLGNPDNNTVNKLILVKYNEGEISLNEFLIWYRNRSEYLKFDTYDLTSYSVSLENYIWRMLRDKLITKEAYSRRLNEKPDVVKQAKWWKDKIVYGTVKNELINSVKPELNEINLPSQKDSLISYSDKIREDLIKKMFYKISALKNKYKVTIDKKLLDEIVVSDENDPRAAEFYFVKKGGLIPRMPYPTIDNDWATWE